MSQWFSQTCLFCIISRVDNDILTAKCIIDLQLGQSFLLLLIVPLFFFETIFVVLNLILKHFVLLLQVYQIWVKFKSVVNWWSSVVPFLNELLEWARIHMLVWPVWAIWSISRDILSFWGAWSKFLCSYLLRAWLLLSLPILLFLIVSDLLLSVITHKINLLFNIRLLLCELLLDFASPVSTPLARRCLRRQFHLVLLEQIHCLWLQLLLGLGSIATV